MNSRVSFRTPRTRRSPAPKDKIFRPDWKSVFEPEDVKQQIHDITRPDS